MAELEKPSSQRIATRLQEMPRDLNGMYAMILKRLDKKGNEDSKKMRERLLSWVAVLELERGHDEATDFFTR